MKGMTDFATLVVLVALSWWIGAERGWRWHAEDHGASSQQSSDIDVEQRCHEELLRTRIKVVPREGKTLGADVFGFDPARDIDDPFAMGAVHHALEKYLVLVFHNVSEAMSPEMHVKFSKRFGPVDPVLSSAPSYLTKGKFNSPDQVHRALQAGAKLEELGQSMLKAATTSGLPREITRVVKEAGDKIAFGEGWHSDLTYRTATPFMAILVSRELPPSGGHTWYSDMRVAWERLPADVKAKIEHLRGNHTDGHDIWASHPVVRNDNKFGFKSLFVNKAFTRHLVVPSEEDFAGVPAAATPTVPIRDLDLDLDHLLQTLLAYVDELPQLHPDAFLDISWAPGQMVMWDNRFSQHAAQGDYKERREMHRTLVSGTIPF